MNKRIGLFLPYFGRFPNYFNLWIKSVAINPEIQFILITDQKLDVKTPSNLHVIKKEFGDIQRLIRQKFSTLDISIENPYKLCDYRPAYGYIFEDLIDKYGLDYWGFCDPDIIWGKIAKFLAAYGFYEHTYDKVGYLGHFQFLSVKEKFLFKNIIDNEKFRNYKYVFTHKYAYHFDEEIGIGLIAKKNGLNILDFESNPPYTDILINKLQFYTNPNANYYDFPRYLKWDSNSGLSQFILNGSRYVKLPSMYVHLQKRKMDIEPELLKKQVFYIFPNQFVSQQTKNNLNVEEYMKDQFYADYYYNKIKTFIKKFSIGQIKHTKYFEKLLLKYYK
ncbi:DUF6625 family protein [Limosilactobacillus reuteri]|mgnify:CR=1 FL=1|uniref:DUF6625 family protein n=1 Tax=Limosilactobacillus reuteri TaxID=1598 RepID=UPI0036D3ECC1